MSSERTTSTLHFRHLIRKDWRQVSPLIGVCVAVGLLTLLLLSLSFQSVDFPLTLELVSALPLLFAAGVGALLISNEKDLRTIMWLRSLPIDRWALLKSKMWISVASLGLVWLVNLVILLGYNGLQRMSVLDWVWYSEVVERPILAVALVLQTFYVLFAGIAVSWRSRSTFTSLFTLLPIAFLPRFVHFAELLVARDTIGGYYISDFFSDSLLFVTLVVSFLGALRLSWVWGVECLSADAAVISERMRSKVALASETTALVTVDWLARRTSTPDVAMLRQFFVQNRLGLLGLFSIYATAFMLFLWDLWQPHPESPFPVIEVVLYALATSWLGVMAFHGDRLNNRIRFYADRGIAPFKVWLTRHAIPVGSLMIVGLVIAICFRWLVKVPLFGSVLHLEFMWLVVFVGLLTVYGFSQWVAQITWNPIIASIAAPLVLFLLGLYASFSYNVLGAPIWLIASAGLVPWVATALGMKLWMDRGHGWRFVGWHMGVALFIGFLPCLPFVYYLLTIRPMDSAVRSRLSELSERKQDANLREYLVYLGFWSIDAVKGQGNGSRIIYWGVEAIDESRKQYERFILDLKKQFEKGPVKVTWGAGDTTLLSSVVVHRGMECEANTNDTKLERYRDAIEVLIAANESQRLSFSLWEQVEADHMACVLLREMRRPGSRMRMGEALYARGIQFFGQTAQRDEARRVALAKTWVSHNKPESKAKRLKTESDFSAWWMPNHFPPGSLLDQFFGDPLKDRCVVELLELLDEKDPSAIEARRLRIAKQWNEELDRSRDDVDIGVLMESHGGRNPYPGSLWRAGWERQAAELVAAYKP